MACCNDDGCCGSRNGTRRTLCMCLPYEDAYMIAAQVISIIAFLISWIWWVTFIIGLVCMVVLQLLWCCRQKDTNGLYASMGLSAVAGICCAVAGILMLVLWKDKPWCSIFVLFEDDDDDYVRDYDYCKEGYWAVVSFVDAVLWFVTGGFIYYFVKSGRHATWEQKLQALDETTATATNIEMGAVPPNLAAATATTGSTPVVAIATTAPVGETRGVAAVAAASATTNADSYVLPDKVDDVA